MEISQIAKVALPPQAAPAGKASAAETAKSFASFLSDSLEQLNNSQLEASRLTEKFVAGEIQDVHQVMLAGVKSSTELQLAVQVRNKVIESYQEIMRMPL
ncbi:flagellar hook-basal body complex protein FliE [Brevibacillus massiliensis]|jgi:flagellar hook-basal body complex protein FliE|uniref:flagellar hook-basal body complex protein FliE n=1 Tax=Brevibacillus massiliensis TaxID=1118054 RepID=UPI000315D32D|nr:flagellar hook-basal body complex protein FliE [Brevibacillus massiliensis]